MDASMVPREMCLLDMIVYPNEAQIVRASKLIDGADRSVIVAGWGVYLQGDQILALAKRLDAPVITTWRADGILPEDNEWAIGICGDVRSSADIKEVLESDLLIILGTF